jgi:uncharacterized protein YjgD (DUF1641 family)
MVENEKTVEKDQVEVALSDIMDDEESLVGILNVIKLLKDSGNLKVLEKLLREMLPGNTESFTSLLDKRELHLGGMSGVNAMVALMASLSGSTSQSALNAILYNSDEIWEAMIDGAKQPDSFSILRLMGMLKDPEVSAGLTALMNALKVLGNLLKKVDKE